MTDIPNLLRSSRTIAVVGMKDESQRSAPAFGIPSILQELGYDVTPVNPNIASSLGKASLPNLAALTAAPDIINVFRRIDAIPALTDEILALPATLRPKAVWFQSGIAHEASAERLRAAGMEVIQDSCLGVLASRYGGPR